MWKEVVACRGFERDAEWSEGLFGAWGSCDIDNRSLA